MLLSRKTKKVYVETGIILDFFLGKEEYRSLFSDSLLKKYEFIMTVPSYQALLLGYHSQDEANKIKFSSIEDRISVLHYNDASQSVMYLKDKGIKKLKRKKKYREFIEVLQSAAGLIDAYITRDEDLLSLGKVENLRLIPFEKL